MNGGKSCKENRKHTTDKQNQIREVKSAFIVVENTAALVMSKSWTVKHNFCFAC